jgi:hypothetical protein
MEIFRHWQDWMSIHSSSIVRFQAQSEEVDWSSYIPPEVEGSLWYDYWHFTFWYALNSGWYAMNNKHSARTDNQLPYQLSAEDTLYVLREVA